MTSDSTHEMFFYILLRYMLDLIEKNANHLHAISFWIILETVFFRGKICIIYNFL